MEEKRELHIKPPESQAEYWAKRYKENPDRTVCEALLAGLGARSSWSRVPAYNDSDKVYCEAKKDFERNDFSSAWDYVDSLTTLVDHWKTCCEELLQFLTVHEYEADENGFPIEKKLKYSDLLLLLKEVADHIHDDVPHQYQKRLLLAEIDRVVNQPTRPAQAKEDR